MSCDVTDDSCHNKVARRKKNILNNYIELAKSLMTCDQGKYQFIYIYKGVTNNLKY